MNKVVEVLLDSVRRQRQELRRYHGGEPKSARQVLARVMQQKGYAELQVHGELQATWQSAVGLELSRQTRLGRIRRGVLDVLVGNSVVLQELMFQKHQILLRLRESVGGEAIQDVRFSSGPIK